MRKLFCAAFFERKKCGKLAKNVFEWPRITSVPCRMHKHANTTIEDGRNKHCHNSPSLWEGGRKRIILRGTISDVCTNFAQMCTLPEFRILQFSLSLFLSLHLSLSLQLSLCYKDKKVRSDPASHPSAKYSGCFLRGRNLFFFFLPFTERAKFRCPEREIFPSFGSFFANPSLIQRREKERECKNSSDLLSLLPMQNPARPWDLKGWKEQESVLPLTR